MKLETKPEEYFWCATCQAVVTLQGSIEYLGGCWQCGGQMFKQTGQLPPPFKIRECHKAERNLLRSGRDAFGRNIVARAVASLGYHLRRIR